MSNDAQRFRGKVPIVGLLFIWYWRKYAFEFYKENVLSVVKIAIIMLHFSFLFYKGNIIIYNTKDNTI